MSILLKIAEHFLSNTVVAETLKSELESILEDKLKISIDDEDLSAIVDALFKCLHMHLTSNIEKTND